MLRPFYEWCARCTLRNKNLRNQKTFQHNSTKDTKDSGY
jgi:hypothetical protein